MTSRTTRRRAAALAVMVPFLAGACTQPWTCPAGEWERAGYSDGIYGQERTRIDAYAGICAKADVTPDREAWTRGYEQGIARYCTERNAYRLGFHGHAWFNTRVCPVEDQRRLDDAYHQGYIYREMLEDLREQRSFWPYVPAVPLVP